MEELIKRKEEKRKTIFKEKTPLNFFHYCKIGFFDLKSELILTILIKEIKKIFNDNNKIKENQIKNNKNHINNNNNIYRNYIIIIIIKFIILNILCKIKCNNYDVLYFQYIKYNIKN